MVNKNMETLHKELDMIQSAISRMSNIQMVIRGWFITMLIAILNLEFTGMIFALSLIYIIFSFSMDYYFLYIEKLYISKYNWVRINRETNDYYYYDMNPYNEQMREKSIGGFDAFSFVHFIYLVSLVIMFIYYYN